MVQESERLYIQLRGAIDKLKVRANARSKTLETGRVAMKSISKNDELKN